MITDAPERPTLSSNYENLRIQTATMTSYERTALAEQREQSSLSHFQRMKLERIFIILFRLYRRMFTFPIQILKRTIDRAVHCMQINGMIGTCLKAGYGDINA